MGIVSPSPSMVGSSIACFYYIPIIPPYHPYFRRVFPASEFISMTNQFNANSPVHITIMLVTCPFCLRSRFKCKTCSFIGSIMQVSCIHPPLLLLKKQENILENPHIPEQSSGDLSKNIVRLALPQRRHGSHNLYLWLKSCLMTTI